MRKVVAIASSVLILLTSVFAYHKYQTYKPKPTPAIQTLQREIKAETQVFQAELQQVTQAHQATQRVTATAQTSLDLLEELKPLDTNQEREVLTVLQLQTVEIQSASQALQTAQSLILNQESLITIQDSQVNHYRLVAILTAIGSVVVIIIIALI